MNDVAKSNGAKDAADAGKIATYDARELVKNGVQSCIVLDENTYYLRITRSGKLILTK